MADDTPAAAQWFWGVVVRVDAADDLLHRLASVRAEGVVPQRPGSGHVTLFYARARSEDGLTTLAGAASPAVARTAPFRVRLGGFGEFVTPGRVVAFLGVEDGLEPLQALRAALCDCDLDTLPHPFVPHCTVVYGDSPEAYAAVRSGIVSTVADLQVDVEVSELWIAGFRKGDHPADDLVYRRRLPLGGRPT